MANLFVQQPFKIIHVDMDCFYAQIEMRDNPSLAGLPVAIGGPSKTQGVLCTSNYEARKFGVRSAQSTFKAFQLCPQLILIPPDFAKYRAASNAIEAIYRTFSDKVQTISLDEAYIDVTPTDHSQHSATIIAREIKQAIWQETGLTASAGVSFNKMLAKIASDWKKPDGLFVISPDMQASFMQSLPLAKIPGIGGVSQQRYQKMGLTVCGDVTRKTLTELSTLLGKKNALDLYRKCLGISNSLVQNAQPKKSFGIEKTFFDALHNQSEINAVIEAIIAAYNKRLVSLDTLHIDGREISHVSIKIRFNDFSTYTRESQVSVIQSQMILSSRQLDQKAVDVIKGMIENLYQKYKKPIRLLGMGIRFKNRESKQLNLLLRQG